MIGENELAKLREQHLKRRPGYDFIDHIGNCVLHDLVDTIEFLLSERKALMAVAKAANEIEDMVEVPYLLGTSGQIIAQEAVDKFRTTLAALKETK